ncbi:MAG: lysine--tRNA ligase [Candidatus Pacearchaeota archaeon]
MKRGDEIIQERKKKLDDMREAGIDPYPHKFDKQNDLEECYNSEIGTQVKSAGRIMTKRDIGKLAFCGLKDGTKQMQIVLKEDYTENESLENFKNYIDAADFVGVEGEIDKTKKGEISIFVKKLTILSKSLYPLPSKWHGIKDKEERYRKKYLDLIMNPEVKEVFDKKEQIFDAIREYFKSRKYKEVHTPYLQTVYGGAEAEPFKTHLNALDIDLYLSISPELYLKRLMVGNYDKVFTIARNFRNEDIDRWHNPEFTMLEAYEAYADYNDMMKMFEELFEYVCKKVNGDTKINVDGKEIDFKTPWPRMKMTDAIKHFGDIDVYEKTEEELKEIVEKEKLEPKENAWGYYVAELFEHYAEPKIEQPTFIIDHPVESTPLCKGHRDDPECRLIERFEPFCMGAELGNAYSELNDPEKQRELLEDQQQKLSEGDAEANPLDEDFLTALNHGMPPTGGLGIGIDRMIMLFTNQYSIRDVLLFPFMKPRE